MEVFFLHPEHKIFQMHIKPTIKHDIHDHDELKCYLFQIRLSLLSQQSIHLAWNHFKEGYCATRSLFIPTSIRLLNKVGI